MNRTAIATLVLGLVAGFASGWLLADSPPDAVPPLPLDGGDPRIERESTPTNETTLPGPAIAVTQRPRPDGPSTSAAAPPVAADTSRTPQAKAPPVLSADMEARVQELAEARRANSLRAYDDAERAARAAVEQQLAEERARLADAERGGAMAMLKELGSKWVAPQELVGSSERFAALFERQTRGARVDARGTDAAARLDDGDVLEVPAGVWPFDTRALNRRARESRAFPRDLLIEGAGIDRSLLVLNDEFDVSHDVHSLTLRDLSVHCNRNYLVQLRRAFTLRLERVRVIGFDSAGGGSSAIVGSEGAVYATDCRFENGFPRDSGNLQDVRGALIARFERCVFDDLDDLYGRHRSLVVFVNCHFPYMSKHHARQFENPRDAARFIDCTVVILDPAQQAEHRKHRRRRSVAEFNPAWKMPKGWR